MPRILTSSKLHSVLVTGGSGFIGSHVVASLQASGHAVRVLDSVPTDATDCVVGDVTDTSTVKKAIQGVDIVIHLAAIASVQRSILEPELTRRTNVEGTRVQLEQSQAAGVKKFIFASSCAVYGDAKPPLHERVSFNPLSLYARTKVDGERLCESFSKKGLPCVVLRFFNVYGSGQSADSDYSAAIPKFIQAARTGSDLTIFGDGKQSRDFVHVDDVISAIRAAMDYPEAFGTFNIGSGKSVSVLELAEKIVALTKSNSKIRFAQARLGEVRHSWADTALAEKELGFEASVGLDAGLETLLGAP
ncbi:NAD-dependent epimerase/dehydratase family protein [Candidatus Micrarchaeota archaeon]|nr:NAD-dependent epimerase/dehydratase family protein [Candidatus Micrarchaeota archaeon]